jgi:hypothetical protein
MAGWILERKLRSGASVFDIGYRVNGRVVKRKGGASRREAEATLLVALADIESGAIRDHTAETLGGYAMRWLARRAPFIESGTQSAYRNDILFRIAPTLGTLRLRDVTAEAIERAILEMQRMKPRRGSGRATYSAKTINNTLTTLSVILGAAVNDGLLRRNPARRQGGAGERRMRVRDRTRTSVQPDREEFGFLGGLVAQSERCQVAPHCTETQENVRHMCYGLHSKPCRRTMIHRCTHRRARFLP